MNKCDFAIVVEFTEEGAERLEEHYEDDGDRVIWFWKSRKEGYQPGQQ